MICDLQSNPIVVVKGAVTFSQDGKVVASVDAEYDTTNLPPELGDLFLQLVQQQGINLVLPSQIVEIGKVGDAPRVGEKPEPKKPEQRYGWKWW